jgi:hypothetical protein
MSTAVPLEPVEKVEKKPRPAVAVSPPPAPVVEAVSAEAEERPLRRDYLALLIWAAGVLLLLLWHFYDVLLTLFSS